MSFHVSELSHNSQQEITKLANFMNCQNFSTKKSEIPGNSRREFLKWRIPGNSREFPVALLAASESNRLLALIL